MSTQNMLRFCERRGRRGMTVRHEWQTWVIGNHSGEHFGMPCGSWAFDGQLGATQKDLLELENFGWEIGETEWEDDQVCIGWLGRLVGVRSRTLLVRRKSVRLGMRFINQQDVQVVATN